MSAPILPHNCTIQFCTRGMLLGAIVSTFCSVVPSSQSCAADRPNLLKVVADFPGSSATVQSIDQANRVIRIQPAEHPTHGWACWWYFKVEGITPGESL